MTLSQALAAAGALGLDRLDAQLLLLQALGRPAADRGWLLAHDGDEMAENVQAAYLALCERRATGEPLAYIVGSREFFGLDLKVDARVLVPRADTETLVVWALEILGRLPGAAPRAIDLGTGSGAIALALKSACPAARVEAVDRSAGALEVAAANARALSLDVSFSQSCWLSGTSGKYDLIVSNPPYVASDDPHLHALWHEPLEALAAGPDGLRDLRVIIAQAPPRLQSGGWLMLEHGHDQAEAVRKLLTSAGFRAVTSRQDLAGIERCSSGQWLELG